MNNRYPASSRSYDLTAVIFLLVFVLGGYVDGWAHNHLDDIETFFTPWHAILYAGFLLSALCFVIPALRNKRAGFDWAHALPQGYAISLIGVIIFFVAGFCDMIWHTLFGVEANIDAFMSPPHIGLFAGTLLMMFGPIRSIALQNDPDRTSWKKNATLVLGMLAIFLQMTFVTQVWLAPGASDASNANGPTSVRWSAAVRASSGVRVSPGRDDEGGLHLLETTSKATSPNNIVLLYIQRAGTATVIIYAALFIGVLLYLIALGRIPIGTFTLLVFIETAMLAIMRSSSVGASLVIPEIVAGLVAGVAADLLYAWWKPAVDRVRQLYLFAFFVPVIYFVLWVVAVQGFAGSWWSEHLLIGSVIYAGAVGLFLAALARGFATTRSTA